MDKKYDALKLENQLCFPLYACAKEVVRRYKPFLDEINLTYTQYIAMLVIWEKDRTTVKRLGEYLFLDSGTLTPVLKSLEKKGYVSRVRDHDDERVILISATKRGLELREKALKVPGEMGMCMAIEPEESSELYRLLYKILRKSAKNIK